MNERPGAAIDSMRTVGHAGGVRAALDAARAALALAGRIVPVPKRVVENPVAIARINHGRWIADCPWCPGASLVDLADPVFFCLSCFNAPAGGEWIRVVMPRERDAIAEALAQRQRPENRNWVPGETVEALAAEHRLMAPVETGVASAQEV